MYRFPRCIGCFNNLSSLYLTILDIGINWPTVQFSAGKFKSVKTAARSAKKSKEQAKSKEVSDEQAEESITCIYSCPQEGCVRLFLRYSALEMHLSLESCSISLEKQTMLDIAKENYSNILQDVGTIPLLSTTYFVIPDDSCPVAEEGWALKGSSKTYRFNKKQKGYLIAKFNIGQESGRNSGVGRSIIGGANIHIFVFCIINFF